MPSPGLLLPGLHHVTAITGDAQKNIDFYTGVLGLRLVKLTVNFDDPSSYHLYYGDELGRPGTILTFFAWPGAGRAIVGPPAVTATSLAVPKQSLNFWTERLNAKGVTADAPVVRFGETVLSFTDPDGMRLDLVGVEAPVGHAWPSGPVPVEHAIRGFGGVTISTRKIESTANVLTNVMGFKTIGSEGDRHRFRAGLGDESDLAFASTVDLLLTPTAARGGMGAGTVHHVAFRTPDDVQHEKWQLDLTRRQFGVSPVMDRNYFHSIYYREPGGVLFEIATNNPGFTADESAEQIGTSLKLPPQYESQRAQIERIVPTLRLPARGMAGQP